jgi:hypothetical protein
MKLPLPFTITIHGTAYSTGESLGGVFANKNELKKHLEWTLLRDLKPEIEVDMDIEFYEHQYREDWKTAHRETENDSESD